MTHSFPTRRSSDLRPNQRQARHGPRDDMPTKRLADNLAAVFRRADSMGGQSRTVPPFIKGCAQCAAVYIFASCAGGHAAGVFASHRPQVINHRILMGCAVSTGLVVEGGGDHAMAPNLRLISSAVG